jgi:hypothetical protein
MGESITIAHIRDFWAIQRYEQPGSMDTSFERHTYGCWYVLND